MCVCVCVCCDSNDPSSFVLASSYFAFEDAFEMVKDIVGVTVAAFEDTVVMEEVTVVEDADVL